MAKAKRKSAQKKKPSTNKVDYVAHYLVPTYNLAENVKMLRVLKGNDGKKTLLVNIWLVNACVGDEQRTMLESFVQQRSLYQIQQEVAINTYELNAAQLSIKYMDNIIMMHKDKSFECKATDNLREALDSMLKDTQIIYNQACAKLVLGVAKQQR
ncbi:MAG: hypothetical protein J6Y49_00060 [Alphaproteobacteria bacterium]|nr:hypothetical protein [Alphaproteobacteria bacterium]